MSETKQSNDDANKRFEAEALVSIETRRIRVLIENQVHHPEYGSIVQIFKTELLEPESYERMREDETGDRY